jgi:hypothetical protein
LVTLLTSVPSHPELSSYIGFFCILWFTWAQVTLYDVRFATDSIIERIAHACHFGVMVGLAIIGPEFLAEDDGWGPLQQLSLILMVNRIVLFCQYGSTLFFTWRYRATRLPLMVVMASLFVAAVLYFGLSFAFYRRTAYDAYLAWYVVAVMEVGVNLALAAHWRAMSFEKTHLVERLTCLTLIIVRYPVPFSHREAEADLNSSARGLSASPRQLSRLRHMTSDSPPPTLALSYQRYWLL